MFILKPDAVVRQHVGARVLSEILGPGCEAKRFEAVRPPRAFLADSHYYMHRGKPFFNWLLDFMTCEQLIVVVLQGENTIRKVRDAIGPTNVEDAVVKNPNSLRARYGMFRGVNLAHASDSASSASHELRSWSVLFGANDDMSASEKLEDYISSNASQRYIETVQYRELAQEIKKNPEKSDQTRMKFVQLLREENQNLEMNRLEYFAKVVLSAI